MPFTNVRLTKVAIFHSLKRLLKRAKPVGGSCKPAQYLFCSTADFISFKSLTIAFLNTPLKKIIGIDFYLAIIFCDWVSCVLVKLMIPPFSSIVIVVIKTNPSISALVE